MNLVFAQNATAGVDHFEWSAIASPQVQGVPISVTVTARDANNATVADYAGSAVISGSGSGGALVVSATSVTFSGGVWAGALSLTSAGTGVVLKALDGAAVGTSLPFDVLPPAPVISSTLAYTSIYSFDSTGNSALPTGGLVQSYDGSLHGATGYDGAMQGTIFRIPTNGSSFSNVGFWGVGIDPKGLILANDGCYYGTTSADSAGWGVGTVYKFNPNLYSVYPISTVCSFNYYTDGAYPQASVTQGSDHCFYGTTANGGNNGNGGVFRVNSNGAKTTLWLFNQADGSNPRCKLVEGADGCFYGTTNGGGAYGLGTVFKITPGGALTTLYSFSGGDGSNPIAGLALASDGNFYGTTYQGGACNLGTVFCITPAGLLTTLHSFDSTHGYNPMAGLIEATDGSFYGTTLSGNGGIFRVAKTGDYSELLTLTGTGGAAPGHYPDSTLLQGTDGKFYGTTLYGGSKGKGNVFKLQHGLFASARVGSGFSYQIAASNSPSGYATDGLPPGLTFNSSSGLISGTPTVSGSFPVGVRASNAGGTGSGILGLRVLPALPLITAPGGVSGTNGVTFSFQIVASNSPAVYEVTGLPAGLHLSTDSPGLITGTPTVTGDFLVGLTASNAGGATSWNIMFFIQNPPPPAITSPLSFQGMRGTPFSYQITADSNPTSFSATGLPAGLTINTATGVISGTPTVSGTFQVIIAANNPGGMGNAALTLTILPPPPVISSLVNLAWSFSLAGWNGRYPTSGLIRGNDGYFYGLTRFGGSGDNGTAYRVSPSGEMSFVCAMNGNGVRPDGALIQADDGSFYGTASAGAATSYGSVFRIANNTMSAVAVFNGANGCYPYGGLIRGSDGDFYGTTSGGGSGNYGTIFRVNTSGSLSTLCSFTGTGGSSPYAGVVQADDGSFYGTLYYGGTSNCGTVYRVAASGSLSTLGYFNRTNGVNPYGGLLKASDGNFYGTTQDGGAGSYGTIFKLTPTGAMATLFSFNRSNGWDPDGTLIQASDGDLYGTTSSGGRYDYGTLFRITANGQLTTLFSFSGTNGSYPVAGLFQDSDGAFYGTTSSGGANGNGTVFKLIEDSQATGYLGGSFNCQVVASDSPSSYSASGLPPGLSLDATTGLITGMPTATGTYVATIAATNTGGTRSSDVTLVINAPPAPQITSLPSVTGTNGFPLSYQIAGTWSPSNFSASGLPAGLQVNAGTGLITGTPSVTGTFIATISAVNLAGSGSATLSINVLPPPPVISNGVSVTPIYTFTSSGASQPHSTLVQGIEGDLYGTTFNDYAFRIGMGGIGGIGGIKFFKSVSNIPKNRNPWQPYAGLVLGSDGTFYGTTCAGGTYNNGSIFSVSTSGSSWVVWSAPSTNNAGSSQSALIQGSDGCYYGTSAYGGANLRGAIFKLNSQGAAVLLHSFQPLVGEGTYPQANLLQADNGDLYGTTYSGGANNQGTIFRLSSSGAFTSLCSFSGSNGSNPAAGLVLGADGNYYGTTTSGGASNCGVVFRMNPNGALTTLCSFTGTTGATLGSSPYGLLLANDGNFYGMTRNGGTNNLGTVYRLTLGGSFTSLFSFTGTAGAVVGACPDAALIQGFDGNFYGTTELGGASNYGTVFQLTQNLVATAAQGSFFGFAIPATNSPNSYSAWGLPSGLSVSASTGIISGVPGTTGTYSVTIAASNAGGTGYGNLVLVVNSAAPMVTSSPNATVRTGEPFGYQITASNSPSTYLATGLPYGLTITPNGAITGTLSTTGTYSATLFARNRAGVGGLGFAITVLPQAPAITGSLNAIATNGSAFQYQITASNSPSSFQALGIPDGLSLNSSTGLISGTPTQSGTFQVTLRATNSGGTGEALLTLTIRSPFEAWKSAKFSPAELLDPAISGETASPAGDGISNLMKYGLNLDPKSYGRAGLPVGSPVILASGTYLTLRYTRVISATDLRYVTEVSGDMQTWSSGADYTAPVSITDQPDGQTQVVVEQDLVPVGSATSRFIRLKVSRP